MWMPKTIAFLSPEPNTVFNPFYLLLRPLLAGVYVFAIFFTTFEEYQDFLSTALRYQQDTFDFVIVGGGSTGAVLANKLSQNFKVLLLEAGGQPNPATRIPLFAFILHGGIPEDWKYETVPQKHSGFGLKDNKIIWHAGKGLGGSALIHGMIYIRGSVQGFDKLAQKTQDPIWSLDNVLKYYNAVEDYNGFFKDSGEHGRGGGMSVESAPLSPFIENLFQAMEEMGYNVTDPNAGGPVKNGIAPVDFYTKHGARWSGFDGYIKPMMDTSQNLTIRKFSYVYKVIMDKDNVANGVEYFRHGSKHVAKARKEVILSAGAIQTPKILMLSGIGPRSHLEELKIPVKIDLPVGEKLQDKFGAVVGPFIIDERKSFLLSRDFSLMNQVRWFLTRKGSFASSRAEASYSITSQRAKRDLQMQNSTENPDIHTYVLSLPLDSRLEDAVYRKSLNFNPRFVNEYLKPEYGKEAFFQLVNVAKPVGHGKLRLRDSSPHSPVLLDPKYLEHPRDMRTLVEGIKFAVKLVEKTKSMQKIHAQLPARPIPGCERHIFKSDAYWECLGRHTTATAFKYCATAPIGMDRSDPFAVVDSRLRVLGAKNLRVIDGSALEESHVSVNHVTCQMLGELASDFITKEYLKL